MVKFYINQIHYLIFILLLTFINLYHFYPNFIISFIIFITLQFSLCFYCSFIIINISFLFVLRLKFHFNLLNFDQNPKVEDSEFYFLNLNDVKFKYLHDFILNFIMCFEHHLR
jgi:hypothetical protein